MESNTAKVNALLEAAEEEGVLSPQSMLALNVPDIGAEIAEGLGVEIDGVRASEVLLVTVMPDDSGSIRFAGNAQVVRDGHNLVVEEVLRESKQRDGVYFHTRYLNGFVLNPYCLLEHAKLLDSSNYNPNQGTPLYDQTVVLLGTVLAKSQEFAEEGVPCRSATLIVSDGADEHSVRHRDPAEVAGVVRDLLREEKHIVAALGIDDAPRECHCGCKTLRDTPLDIRECPECGHSFHRTNFREVFLAMGIPDEWILTPKNTAAEIRAAFALFSRTSAEASKGGASFSQVAVGGFGN